MNTFGPECGRRGLGESPGISHPSPGLHIPVTDPAFATGRSVHTSIAKTFEPRPGHRLRPGERSHVYHALSVMAGKDSGRVWPPSMISAWPVMYEASSVAKKRQAYPMSLEVPRAPIGIDASIERR
jgi:hypothetical protein